MYGVRGPAHRWLFSYLSNRQQYVEYNNDVSSYQNIVCGVPQGSILGPLLFIIYINDLASAAPNLFSLMFADDSNMFLQGKDLKHMQEIMNKDLYNVSIWLKVNKLSLNIDKTHFMLFCGRKKPAVELNIQIDGQNIQRVTETKFLGVIIDELLSWKDHIIHISKKVSRATGILNKIKYKLDKATLRNLYYTFLYPYLIYCNHVWGNACQSYMRKLITLQKKAIRIITSAKYNAHTTGLFVELKCLTIAQIHTYIMSIFMYKFIHKELPCIFVNMFIFNVDVHSYPTRASHHLHLPQVHTSLSQKAPRYYGSVLWNAICTKFQNCTSLDMFKRHYKSYLIEHQMNG